MTAIEMKGASYSYREDAGVVVHDIDLRIATGEFIGIVGPNGAGKSTLCRMIGGQAPQYFGGDLTGSVTVAGYDVAETSQADLAHHVGFVFENPHDQLTGASVTVLEEVAFALENAGTAREEMRRRGLHALRRVGLEDFADRHPKRLSGGQTQRLALASVLVSEPEILVLDEPTSQLDPRGAREVFTVLSSLCEEGYTVVVVSHDLDRLSAHCGRLLVMDAGRLLVDAAPEEAFAHTSERLPSVQAPELLRVHEVARSRGLTSSEWTLRQFDTWLADVDYDQAPQAPALTAPQRESAAAPAEPAAMTLTDVEFTYPSGQAALRGITTELDRGCICIMGSNGAGKSTLTRMLNGLLRPTRGVVQLFGQETADRPIHDIAHTVGLAFQNPDDQLFRTEVESEVRFGPENLGRKGEELDQLSQEALEAMSLTDVREESPFDLDFSRRRHVAIASVIAMGTRIVVLDEPTGGQDAEGAHRIGQAIDRLVQEGRLVIVVTHDVTFAREHADRVIAMHAGNVLAEGTPREVLGRPDLLQQSGVDAPLPTLLGVQLGLSSPVLTVEELIELIEAEKPDNEVVPT